MQPPPQGWLERAANWYARDYLRCPTGTELDTLPGRGFFLSSPLRLVLSLLVGDVDACPVDESTACGLRWLLIVGCSPFTVATSLDDSGTIVVRFEE